MSVLQTNPLVIDPSTGQPTSYTKANELPALLAAAEGNIGVIYGDSNGLPTIGIGMAVGAGTAVAAMEIAAVLQEIGAFNGVDAKWQAQNPGGNRDGSDCSGSLSAIDSVAVIRVVGLGDAGAPNQFDNLGAKYL